MSNLIIKLQFLLVGFIVCVHVNLFAQQISLRGVVTDYRTGQTISHATVLLKHQPTGELYRGTRTDNNGFYQIGRLETGTYSLVISFLGFEEHQSLIELESVSPTQVVNVALKPISTELETLVIAAERQRDVAPGQIKISPEQLRRAPAPSANADLVNYLQTLPGVVAAGDRGGQLFVRGGSSTENRYLVDGLQIYQPFHIVGFFSVFPEDVLASADFYAGGFNARYSQSTSAIMDVKLRNGNLHNSGWAVSASPFVTDIFIESPVTKGKSTVWASFRNSMIEQSSPHFLNEQQPLKFDNQIIKYSMIDGNLGCSANFLRTYDRGQLDYSGGDYFKWQNIVSGGRCALVSPDGNVGHMDINFGVTYFNNETGNSNNEMGKRFSSVLKSHVDVNLTHYIQSVRLNYGAFTNYNTINYDISDRFLSIQKNEEIFISSGLYLSAMFPIARTLSLETGFNYTSYLGLHDSSLEPRFQFTWRPRNIPDEKIHFSAGIYRQAMVGISDFRDAGSAFTAWVLPTDSNKFMTSYQFLAGWLQPLGTNLFFSVEGYLKNTVDIPVSTWTTIAQFSTDVSYADADIVGFDVSLDFDYNNFYLTAGYGYSMTTYQTEQPLFRNWFGENIQRYHPAHDRRHQITIQSGISYKRFDLAINWSVGTGLPYTRPMGFDSYLDYYDRPPNVSIEYGKPRILMDKPFSARLPDYHRLDVSLSRRFQVGGIHINSQVGAINSYNWSNLFYYDIYNQKGIYQLPFVPYASLKIGTK